MFIWRNRLRSDTVEPPLTSEYEAVRYFTRRDLLDEDVAREREKIPLSGSPENLV